MTGFRSWVMRRPADRAGARPRVPGFAGAALAAALVAAVSPTGGEAQPGNGTVVERARAIHERAITMDTHTDIEPVHFTAAEPNYVTGHPDTKVDLPSMEEGGLRAVWFSMHQEQEQDFTAEGYLRPYNTAMDKVLAIRRLTSELAPERIGLALTAADVRGIAAEGRLVALMGMENGYALGEDVENVRRFYELGVRYLSLAHFGANQLADSSTGEQDGYRWNGLSPLGREVVVEANRLGIILDISHPSKEANLQTMALSGAPVMASHSSVRALTNHYRNLDDEQLLALQANGGVVHVVAYSPYLVPGRTATVADLVDHIDYVVDLIGIDHVGISSDFDGGGWIEGWNDASETFNVTLELVRRGYSEEEIRKIWSGNLLRVMEAVERVAAEMATEAMP